MSKPQVTITLGRMGQVVKRPESSSSEYVPSVGTKRSVKDRLGTNTSDQHKSKRQRRENTKRSLGEDVDGVPVNQNDLRYKLMRKKMSRNSEDKRNVDLRTKLSRTAQPQTRTDPRQRMPERRVIDARQRVPEPKATGTRQQMPDTTGIIRRVPLSRDTDYLDQNEPLRKSYSGWSLDGLRQRSPDRLLSSSRDALRRRSPDRLISMRDGLRHRSPDRLLSTSRGLSPLRTVAVRRPVGQMSSVTHIDASRSTAYIGKNVFDSSRPTSFMPKASVQQEAGNPVTRNPPPSASAVTQKTSYVREEVTVSSLLHSLGLGKYAILFQAEEVDMPALKQMGDTDLKELGIPMGPRKKILLSVAGRSKRHP